VEFNIYSANTVGMAVRTNGATGTPYGGTGSVNLAGGHPIGVTISYNGTALSATLTDAVSHVSFVTNTSLNIPAVLGTNTAYVGLTGADGGTSSTQVVSNFQFASQVALSSLSVGTNTVEISWPNSAGGLVLQQAPSVVSAWASANNSAVVNSNGTNQAIVQPQGANGFYRLATP
jgi:redox-regulated HSP33 family molecular chaperone